MFIFQATVLRFIAKFNAKFHHNISKITFGTLLSVRMFCLISVFWVLPSAATGNETLKLQGRVLLDLSPPPFLGEIRVVYLDLINDNPVILQIWEHTQSSNLFRLVWAKKFRVARNNTGSHKVGPSYASYTLCHNKA